MMNTEPTRILMLKLLRMQTTFRQAIQRRLRLESIDLTFEMLQIMVILWKSDGVNQQELADATFKDKASLTSIINNLQAKGLVVRSRDSADRRNNVINLTPSGHQMGERVEPLLISLYAQAGAKTDPHQTALCIEYLDNLNNAFKDHE